MTPAARLLAAVEGGNVIASDVAAAFPEKGIDTSYFKVRAICADKDVNAAISLCETMLPGWRWMVCNTDASVYETYPDRAYSATNPDPARAILIAVLRALVAGEGK